MLALDLLIVFFALVGHTALSIVLFNGLHAVNLPCRVINALEKVIVAGAAAVLIAYAGWFFVSGALILGRSWQSPLEWLALAYIVGCSIAAPYVTAKWAKWRFFTPQPAGRISNHTTVVNVAHALGHRPLGNARTKMLAAIPGNQILRLDVHEKVLALDRLDERLDGLSIAHLSDLHMSGYLTRSFFEYVVEHTNKLDADLVAITGDIVEKSKCVDWIPATLGRLKSRYGVYFILGNHDKRLRDVPALRAALTDIGLIDMGSQWRALNIRDVPIELAGSEVPWFGNAGEIAARAPAADGVQYADDQRPLRILLSHSPDQIYWASSLGFDLMLAGHTHGGQIRFPLIGTTICPSRYGPKYAADVYFEHPTLMHVTRGVSALHQLRFNCPPELTKIVLRTVRAR